MKKFKNLKILKLEENSIDSLIQLTSFEGIQTLESLIVENNPICSFTYLLFFIIYRMPNLIKVKFNKSLIKKL